MVVPLVLTSLVPLLLPQLVPLPSLFSRGADVRNFLQFRIFLFNFFLQCFRNFSATAAAIMF